MDDPEVVPNTEYIINYLEQQTNNANPTCRGEIMGAVGVGIASRYESFCAKCVQQVEDDDAFCRLIYRFTVNKMI